MRNWIFVRVDTDQAGLYGWGEATLEWKTRAVAGAVEDLAPLVIGRDPRDIERNVRIMKKHSFWRLGAIGMSAVSGIEIALWDIFGKSLGVPVWRLLGGQVREKVWVYTHLGLGDMRAVYETESANALTERAQEVLARGYRAMKVVIIPYTHYSALLPQVDRTQRMMSALREAVGPEVEIMVDFHGRPASVAAALAYIEALKPGRPMFVEEVLPPGDSVGLREVAAKTSVPIAAGERLIEPIEFEDALSPSLDQHRPTRYLSLRRPVGGEKDRRHGGSRGNRRRPAQSARADRRRRGAAFRRFDRQIMSSRRKWLARRLGILRSCAGPIKMIDGFWQVPTEPGLGIEVDEGECARHPFQPETPHATNAVLDDGAIVDW